MNSPPQLQLQGASRVTGGFAHGRALGNVFNLADAQDASLDDLGPMMGKDGWRALGPWHLPLLTVFDCCSNSKFES